MFKRPIIKFLKFLNRKVFSSFKNSVTVMEGLGLQARN